MWIIIKFYNIIIKSANVDKGGGVELMFILDKKNGLERPDGLVLSCE